MFTHRLKKMLFGNLKRQYKQKDGEATTLMAAQRIQTHLVGNRQALA